MRLMSELEKGWIDSAEIKRAFAQHSGLSNFLNIAC